MKTTGLKTQMTSCYNYNLHFSLKSEQTVYNPGVGSAAQLVTYTSVLDMLARKTSLKSGSWEANVLGAALSGFVVAVVINPLDVVSTRMYNQPGQKRMYNGFLDCVMKILRAEGISAFYKGLFAQYLRIGPHSFLSLIFWHHARSSLGLTR